MFVEDDSTVAVTVHYRKIGHHYLSYSNEQFRNLNDAIEDKTKFKSLTVTMEELSWGIYNELQEGAIYIDGEGNRCFNNKKFKESRLAKLAKAWDATVMKDGQSVPIPINEKQIKKLAPEIAESILNSYDEVAFLSEEDEGK